MKKRYITSLFCASCFSLLCFSWPVFAAAASSATSTATVTFTPGTEPTSPVDPDDPSKPFYKSDKLEEFKKKQEELARRKYGPTFDFEKF